MGKWIFCLCVAMAAMAASPAGAMATNSPELVENGTRVEPGNLINGTKVTNALFTDSSGNILLSCEVATLTGQVTKNDGSNVEVTISSAIFTNAGGANCSGSLGSTKVTMNPTTNGLPWCLRSTTTMATDEFQIRGNSCAGASRSMRYVLDLPFGVECTYQRSAARIGSFTTGIGKTILSSTTAESPLQEGSFGCPSALFLDLSFTLETDDAGTNRVDLV
jgi:hypothetical protein